MSEDLALRDFQLAAHDHLRAGFRAGHKRQMLMLPTGAGKSVIAAHLMREAQRRMSRTWFLVDRIVLATQFSNLLDRYGIPHGIIQAGNPRFRMWERLQIASAQTLERRGFANDVELLIVDEAHCCRKHTLDFIAANPQIPVLGLSATPLTAGLGKVYSNLLCPITTNALIEQKWLVPLVMYAAASSIDMKGARLVAGEWVEKDIEQRASKIVGDVVAEWQAKTTQHFGGPVKTLVYSATVAHGDELCRQFRAAGYDFRQFSYRDSESDRGAIVEEFRKPNSAIHGLVSCEVLVKGADFPDVRCLSVARPYRKNLMGHIQMLGRGMRPFPGKTYCLLLDHSNNCLRFRSRTEALWQDGLDKLSVEDKLEKSQTTPEQDEKVAREMRCKACGFVLAAEHKACPQCGAEVHRRGLVEAVPGTLEAINPKDAQRELFDNKPEVWRQLCALAIERKPGDVDAARRFALAQYRALYNQWPPEPFVPEPTVVASMLLRRRVKHLMIRWASVNRKWMPGR